MHFLWFLAVFKLMSDSLTVIYVEPHQCPSHHAILLTQGRICEIFAKKFWELAILKNGHFWKTAILDFFFKKKYFLCFIPMKISQSLLVSKDGSKFWSIQTFFCVKTMFNDTYNKIATGSYGVLINFKLCVCPKKDTKPLIGM